jgi:hypothetical protein
MVWTCSWNGETKTQTEPGGEISSETAIWEPRKG